MISVVLLITLVCIAAVTDIWLHKVFNWTTYTGICAAFLLSGIASVLSYDAGDSGAGSSQAFLKAEWFSQIGIGQSIAGFLICGVLLLVCFALFNVGGGDVKLIAMVGAFVGIESGIETLLWTFVMGGATALIVLIWRVGVFQFMRRIFQIVMWKIRLGGWGPLKDEEREELKMPLFLAPNALMAVLIVQFSIADKIF